MSRGNHETSCPKFYFWRAKTGRQQRHSQIENALVREIINRVTCFPIAEQGTLIKGEIERLIDLACSGSNMAKDYIFAILTNQQLITILSTSSECSQLIRLLGELARGTRDYRFANLYVFVSLLSVQDNDAWELLDNIASGDDENALQAAALRFLLYFDYTCRIQKVTQVFIFIHSVFNNFICPTKVRNATSRITPRRRCFQ
jgi:hypothetical protein